MNKVRDQVWVMRQLISGVDKKQEEFFHDQDLQ